VNIQAQTQHLRDIAARLGKHGSSHDRHWREHPAVATDDALTFGQRAADHMKAIFSTWTALGVILLFMAVWLKSGGFGRDAFPFILLNLCLSCLAALQCFILLIAAKRADQIAAAIALHTLQNTESIKQLIEQNTELTKALHDHILTSTTSAPDTAVPETAGASVANGKPAVRRSGRRRAATRQ